MKHRRYTIDIYEGIGAKFRCHSKNPKYKGEPYTIATVTRECIQGTTEPPNPHSDPESRAIHLEWNNPVWPEEDLIHNEILYEKDVLEACVKYAASEFLNVPDTLHPSVCIPNHRDEPPEEHSGLPRQRAEAEWAAKHRRSQ